MSENTTPPALAEQPLKDFILDLESRLNRERASFAENAFGIGCSAVVVPVLLVVGLAFLLGARGWVAFFFTLTSTALVAFVLVSMFANQAQANAARRIFREEIQPALQACEQRYNCSAAEVLAAAAQILPADATLRSFLDLQSPSPAESLEEPPLSPSADL